MSPKKKLLLVAAMLAAVVMAILVFILLGGKPDVRHIPRPVPLPALGERDAKVRVEKAALSLETATTAIAPPKPPRPVPPQLEDARPLMTRRPMPVAESVATLPALSPSPEPFNGCAYNRGYRDGFKAGIAAGAELEESREGSRLFQALFPEDLPEGTALNLALYAFLGTWLAALTLYLLGKRIFGLPVLSGRRMHCLPSPSHSQEKSAPRWWKNKPKPRRAMRRAGGLCLAFFLAVSGFGCTAGKSGQTDATVPMPPLKETPGTTQQPAQTGQTGGTPSATPEAANPAPANQAVPTGAMLVMEEPVPKASGPRPDDPAELAELLDLQASASRKETAVTRLRPSAIRDAARMTTFQTAIAWRYGKLLEAVDRHGAILETAFNFTPLMMTQGDALIMPPVLTRAGASMRIDDDGTATTASATYEMLQKARYVPVAPHWRSYLMTDNFPEPEQPNPAVLPQNGRERAIWRAAVREAWAQGVEEADNLFTDNVSRLVRDYRGVLLYHLLTAQHLLSRIRTADADLGVRVTGDGNRMNLGQKVYRITEPSFFVTPRAEQVKDRRNKHGR